MTIFAIGFSALRTNQFGLQAASHNIANAGTEGYHRRSVRLEADYLPIHATDAKFFNGRGVTVGDFSSVRDIASESLLTSAVGDLARADQSVAYLRRIETFLANGEDSVAEKVNHLFGELQKLSSNPSVDTLQAAVVDAGKDLAHSIQSNAQQLELIGRQAEFELTREIEVANTRLVKLQELNLRISDLELQGGNALDERDERDRLVNDIAESIGLKRTIGGDNAFRLGNTGFQLNNSAIQLSSEVQDDGQLRLVLDGQASIEVGGQLGALVDIYNQAIPTYRESLDQLSSDLVRLFDDVHARGVGAEGSFSQLSSTRPVASADVPLSEAGLIVPLTAGNLAVSIIDPSGARLVSRISIDPDTDSLDDVVSRFNAIPGFSASVAPSGNVKFFAQAGYEFDFTSSLATSPDLSSYTGTAVPTLSGSVESASNEDVRLRVVGTGNIGSGDLKLDLLASDGSVLEQINIGLGYESNSIIDLGDGVQISFPSGTVNDGDLLTIERNGTPDETGILSALGVNSFFVGTTAADFRINEELEENPKRLALGDNSVSGDSRNLLRLLELKNQSVAEDGATLSGAALSISTSIALAVNSEVAQIDQLSGLKLRLEQERDSYSGVDLNEELLHLQNFQRSYEAAAQIIQAADRMYEELLGIIR